jgi:hypothetical protein
MPLEAQAGLPVLLNGKGAGPAKFGRDANWAQEASGTKGKSEIKRAIRGYRSCARLRLLGTALLSSSRERRSVVAKT